MTWSLGRGILQNAESRMKNELGLGTWVNQVPISVIRLGKQTWNLIHSVNFLTLLITRLQSHSVFYIRRKLNAERRVTLQV